MRPNEVQQVQDSLAFSLMGSPINDVKANAGNEIGFKESLGCFDNSNFSYVDIVSSKIGGCEVLLFSTDDAFQIIMHTFVAIAVRSI